MDPLKCFHSLLTHDLTRPSDGQVFNGIPHLIDKSVSILQHEPKALTVHVSNTSFLYPVDDFLEETPEGVQYQKILNVGPGELLCMLLLFHHFSSLSLPCPLASRRAREERGLGGPGRHCGWLSSRATTWRAWVHCVASVSWLLARSGA